MSVQVTPVSPCRTHSSSFSYLAYGVPDDSVSVYGENQGRVALIWINEPRRDQEIV